MSFRSGVVAVVGRPNVGKSTFVNLAVGQKVSIVSDKAQTTRRRIMAVKTTDEYQMVFVDTPGMHAPHHRLGKALNETARQSVMDVDVLLVIVDGSKRPNSDDATLAKMLRETGSLDPERTVLCINKMDKLKAEDVQERFDAYNALFPASETMMTSMTKQQNVDLLLGLLLQRLPEGPPHYDSETVTDLPMRTLAAELVREKALNLTREEVPHALDAYTENWEEDEDGVDVSVVLLVEREGQKAIVIGKKGSMLTKIGMEARLEIQEIVGKKVFLELFVKVRENWRQNPTILRDLEYF